MSGYGNDGYADFGGGGGGGGDWSGYGKGGVSSYCYNINMHVSCKTINCYLSNFSFCSIFDKNFSWE